jgi:dUTP pyrophosphatase
MPKAAHPGDAADLYAVEQVILRPGVPALVKTGLVLDLPEGWRAWITPRSGLALKHGVTVANAPGLIDAGYRGEVGVILVWGGHAPNVTEYEMFDPASGVTHRLRTTEFHIAPGDRIAQISFARIEPTQLVQGAEISATERGASGFGSTGK